jgi:hypothetical protein
MLSSARFRRLRARVEAIVAAMERGGRLFYIGAGTSGTARRARRVGVSTYVFRFAPTSCRESSRAASRRCRGRPKPPRTTRPSGRAI